MALREIVRYPDSRLRQPTRDVTSFDAELKQLVTDMTETMYAANGAGLAAIQVGDLRRVFLVEGHVAGGAEDAPPMVFINPKIEWLSPDTETTDEGCLSFPTIYVPVKRSMSARVRAFDVDDKEFVVEGSALFARAMQHEHDHLENRLLIDWVGPLKKQMIKRKLERLTREEIEDAMAAGE